MHDMRLVRCSAPRWPSHLPQRHQYQVFRALALCRNFLIAFHDGLYACVLVCMLSHLPLALLLLLVDRFFVRGHVCVVIRCGPESFPLPADIKTAPGCYIVLWFCCRSPVWMFHSVTPPPKTSYNMTAWNNMWDIHRFCLY